MYTEEQIAEWKLKAEKWDNLASEIEQCYCDENGDYIDDDDNDHGVDLCTIGEIAATAFGWL